MTPAEINRLLAEEVMGWTHTRGRGAGECPYYARADGTPAIAELYWRPMTDLNDADKVLEVLRKGWRGHARIWVCIEDNQDSYDCKLSGADSPTYSGWGKTLAEAICLAVVAVVKGEKP